MTQQVSKFVFPLTGQETRIVDIEGNPWWFLKDVCDILGIGNVTDAASRLDDDEKSTFDSIEGGPARVLINEAGLYSLIMSSRKPEAKTFRRWVTHEVIPQIRKTGAYGQPQITTNYDLSDPEQMFQLALHHAQERMKLQAEVDVLKPKADALKRLEGADGSLCITNAAKALCVRPKDLFSYLQTSKWIYKRPGSGTWIGYQDKIQAGLVEMSEYVQTKSDGTEAVRVQAKITAKGLARLAVEFEAVPSN